MNMFTLNVKPRKRGRPAGETAQGAAARERLYQVAIGMIAKRGYEATTLRDIAREADVSVGLLYRYFPGKQAIVLALYDELSADYARQAAAMPDGRWRDRFLFALTKSLDVLRPHQVALRALTPVMVGDPEEGIFSTRTAFSRLRVQRVFENAVVQSSDAPKQPLARGARPSALPRAPVGAALVAARQERESARHEGSRRRDGANSAFCDSRASCAASSTIRDRR